LCQGGQGGQVDVIGHIRHNRPDTHKPVRAVQRGVIPKRDIQLDDPSRFFCRIFVRWSSAEHRGMLLRMKTSLSLTPLLVAGGLLLGTVCPSQAAEQIVGGYSEASITNAEVVAAAQFAIKAQAAIPEQKIIITLVELLSVRQQVVAGMNYRLRIKVKFDGKVKEAEAVVWRKLTGEHELTSWTWK
jgi:hypothetical protein